MIPKLNSQISWLATCIALLLLGPLQAQEKKPIVTFNGLGRVIIANNQLGGEITQTDTTTARRTTDGEFLLDLDIKATPNDKTQVGTILRLRQEFGGFFGAGMSVEVRELYGRGVIGNVLRWHAGDMDLGWSTYSLNNYVEEATINEPAAFQVLKDVIYYEQFYNQPGSRRFQGGRLELGLAAPGVDQIDLDGFFVRVRGTDFFSIPSRFVGGGRLKLANSRAGFIHFNYVNTWDDLGVGEVTKGIRNSVITSEFRGDILKNEDNRLSITGEAGLSSVREKSDTVFTYDKSDFFIDAGVEWEFKKSDLTLGVFYQDVGPDFFNVAAQSKRVDFDRTKANFNRIGNDQEVRPIGLYDFVNDRSIYTFQLTDRLMEYDPRFSNVLPYGQATPNRRGARIEVDYAPEKKPLEGRLTAAYLNEIRGQGTEELRSFLYLRASGDLHIQRFFDGKKNLTLTFGYQFENSNRGGETIEQVDLTNHLIDLGIEWELVKQLDLLGGARLLFSEGQEYQPVYTRLNEVENFLQLNAQDTETLLGASLRYRFNEKIALTVAYQNYSFERQTQADQALQINQFYLLYNMRF